MSPLRYGLLAAFVICLVCVTGTYGTCEANTCTAGVQCYCGDIPPMLGSPGSYDPDQTCYDETDIINFDCSGDLNGPPFNQCNAGGTWNFPFGPTCEGVTLCDKPNVPTDGSISPDEQTYDLYVRITYTCNNGFSLVGPSEAVCESGGVWNPATTPTCEAACVKPVLTDGDVSPDKATYENGEVLTYSCDGNYTLVGVSTCTCRDGVYDPPNPPTCFSKCNPPVVADSDYSRQLDPVDHASTITVKCNAGFSTGTGTETDMTCTNGNFDVVAPICYENCPVLPTFNNGDRTGDSTPYYDGEVLSYDCDDGYTLVGATSITCSDGTWVDDQPVCKANCNVSPVPNSDFSSRTPVVHNTSFTITCDTDYSTGTSLTTNLTCNDGVISPSVLPTCYADCTPPLVDYSDHRTQQPTVFHTVLIDVDCWANYSTGPDSQSTQLSCDDGSFSGDDPTCYENCPDVVDPDNGQISSGNSPFFHGEVVSFQCNANYTLVGEEDIMCSDGSWDYSPPVCSGKCPRPVITDSNSTSSTPLLDHGEDVAVTCNYGFSNGDSRHSTSTCESGTLVPDVPLCYADCTPPVVPNSNYEPPASDVYHTEVIIITCNAGYSTGTPDSTYLRCTDGDFNATAPICYLDCTPPITPYSDYSTQQPDVRHTDEFTISCWSNYSTGPDSQATTLTCDNGTVTGEDATCYENCKAPNIPNSDYSSPQPDLFHEETFNVTCDDDYSNGPTMYFSQICNNGVLTGGDPYCYANCLDVGQIDDGTYTGDTLPFQHGESITFSCNENFTLVGESDLTCMSGAWDNANPSCEADCLPPIIPHSDYSSSQPSVDHGVNITITCDPGYSTGPEMAQTITCDDGDFSPNPLDCLSHCIPPIVDNSDYDTQQDAVPHSTSFDITCHANYTAGYFSPTATLTCNDGELDNENTTCYANCPDPGQPADGSYEYDGDGFYHGTVVNYYCNARFDLIGANEIICLDGEWSDVRPNCTDTELYDLIMLTCGPTSMEVEIPIALLEDIGPTDIGMENDLGCMGHVDGDLIKVNTSLVGCNTNKTQNETHDTYHNRVVNNYYADVITRVADVQIPLTCSYERNQQVRAVRYAISDYVIGKHLEEEGTYQTSFGIFNTSKYDHRYSDGAAVNIEIDSWLYFELELTTDLSDNKLVIQSCWATPTMDGSGDTSHQLAEDGCGVDETFRFIGGINRGTIIQFALDSFRFVDDADKEVYVHCTVYVCHTASTGPQCAFTCPTSTANRRRRDAADPSPINRDNDWTGRNMTLDEKDVRMKRANMHDPIVKYVRAGPICWKSDDMPEPQIFHTTNQSTTSWMNSVIGLGVIIAVFSVILMVVVRHYRRRLVKKEYRYEQLNSCS